MSTDFSIRPAGTPVPILIPPSSSDGARGGVETQLPESQSVTATDASGASRNDSPSFSSSASVLHQAFFDTAAASIVFQSVNDQTGQVVQQYPDDATLRRRAYFHSLDQKDSSSRPLATDVTA